MKIFIAGNFTILILYFHLHRRVTFYIIRNYIPAFLVVQVSWLSFWVDRDSVPARVGMGITTILTMTTLLIGVGQQDLPVVSYVKALDWYYIGCFTFVFMALCEYAAVNYFDKKQRKRAVGLAEGKHDINSNNAITNSELKFGINLAPSQFIKSCQEPKSKQREEITPLPAQLHFSDIIEVTCRRMFPVLFFLFNIVYFTVFNVKSEER